MVKLLFYRHKYSAVVLFPNQLPFHEERTTITRLSIATIIRYLLSHFFTGRLLEKRDNMPT